MAARLPALLERDGDDLFVPLTFWLSQRVEQVTWDEIVDDPALGTFTLKSAQKVFSADGVVNWFDSCLEAESAGVICTREAAGTVTKAVGSAGPHLDAQTILQGRTVQSAIEIAARLCQQSGDQGLVLGYLTGPVTVLQRLFRDPAQDAAASLATAAKVATALAKAYCEAGVSALLLAEEEPVMDASPIEALDALFNLVDYYGTPILYLARHPLPSAVVETLTRMGATVVGADADDEIVPLPAGVASAAGWVAIRLGRRGGGKRRLVISTWDIPTDTAPEDLVAIARQIRLA